MNPCCKTAPAALMLAVALHAQAAPLVVSHPITVAHGAPHFGTYATTASEPLTVTSAGSIVAPPGENAIALLGTLDNFGTIRAAFGSETFGLWLGGAYSENRAGATIEAHSLTLSGTTAQSLVNRGTLVTGAYTLDDGRLATHAAQSPFAAIGEHATVRNEYGGAGSALAKWTSYGDVAVGGVLDNEQSFELRRNPLLLPGSNPNLYHPTLSISMPWSGTVQARVDNVGQLVVNTGTSVRNDGLLRNGGTMVVDLAATLFSNPDRVALDNQRVVGRFENTGLYLHRGYALSRGEVVTSGSFTIGQTGTWIDEGSFANAGTLAIDSGGDWSTRQGAENRAGAIWSIAGRAQMLPGAVLKNAGRMAVADGGLLEMAEGSVLYTGYDATGQGLLEVSGRLNVAGQLVVNGDPFVAGDAQATGLAVLRGGRVEVLASGLLPLGASHNVEGQGRIVNDGLFTVRNGASVAVGAFDQRDGQLVIEAGATLATMGGRLTMTGGQLSGHGRINGDVFVQGTRPADPSDPACRAFATPGVACFTPGSSPGHMDIDGSLALGDGAVLELEIERDAAGILHWDTVTAGSMSFGQGSLIRVLIGEGAPGAGVEHLSFVTCLSGACDFSGASFDIRGGQGGSFGFDGSGGLSFALAPAVPEPGTWGLMLAGVAAVGWVARRRHPR